MKKKGLLLILVALICLLFVTPVNKEVKAAEGDTYTLIADNDNFNIGDQVVFAHSGKVVAMGSISTTSTKYGLSQDVTISGNQVTINNNVMVLTVCEGSTSGTYAFKNSNNQYLSWTSGNSLTTSSVLNAASSWTVDIKSGVAVIKNANDTSRYLQYNTGNPRFACYTNSQDSFGIYEFKVTTTWDLLSGEFLYYYNDGYYTKDTVINIDAKKVGTDLEGLVHAYDPVNKLANTKTTIYVGDYLYFKDTKTGYGTTEDGKNLTSLKYNSESGKYEVATTHANLPGMEEYYCTLEDFYTGEHGSAHVGENILDISAGWTVDENGVYTSSHEDVIAAFALFTAPTWLNLGEDYNKYMDYSKATVEVNLEGNLEMKLWVSVGDKDGKLFDTAEVDENNKNAVFSKAIITDHNISTVNKAAKEVENLGCEISASIDLENLTSSVIKSYPGLSVTWSLNDKDITTLTYSKPNEDTTITLTATLKLGKQIKVVSVEFVQLKYVETSQPINKKYTLSTYAAGKQYAENEAHTLDDYVTVTTTQCHFTSELRIYSSDQHNGYAVIYASGKVFTSIGFNAGNKVDTLNVYGSTDGITWTLIKGVSISSTSYKDYSLSIDATAGYTYIKLDVKGSNQVRVKSITVGAE